MNHMTSTARSESYKEISVNPRFNSYDLSFCKGALGMALNDSKSLTVYLASSILRGRDLTIATGTASRLLGAGLRYTGIETMERGNMVYQVSRDTPVPDFDYPLPTDAQTTGLLSPLLGYMRADAEVEDGPQFTVGVVNLQIAEFTAVEF